MHDYPLPRAAPVAAGAARGVCAGGTDRTVWCASKDCQREDDARSSGLVVCGHNILNFHRPVAGIRSQPAAHRCSQKGAVTRQD